MATKNKKGRIEGTAGSSMATKKEIELDCWADVWLKSKTGTIKYRVGVLNIEIVPEKCECVSPLPKDEIIERFSCRQLLELKGEVIDIGYQTKKTKWQYLMQLFKRSVEKVQRRLRK